MTIEEITAATDVSALYEAQRAAKASGDEVIERAAGRRLRELAGGNSMNVVGGKAIALDPSAGPIVSAPEGG